MELWWFWITAIIAIGLKKLFDLVIQIRQLPPGPWGLPFIGYLPWTSHEAYTTFVELGKKYGGLFSVTLGGDTMVILNDWPTIKATLVDNSKLFSGRPNTFMFKASIDRKNIAFSDGAVWNVQRRTTVQCLRNTGMGRKSMEDIIKDSIQMLTDDLIISNDKVVPMNSMFYSTIFRINWSFIQGYSGLDENDKMKKLAKITKKVVHHLGTNDAVNVFPWLRFVPPNGFGFRKFQKCNNKLKSLLRNLIHERMERSPNGEESDFIDFYIAEIKKHTKDGEETAPFDTEHIIGTVWDMFLAGGDTVNVTTQWGFLYLGYFDEVQKKLQSELDTVIGKQRLLTISDFPQLPYLDAVVKEIHRMASILPLSVPHCPNENFKINGYTIPKGTTCLQNMYAVHHDPILWDEPEKFKPERFLTIDDKPISPPYFMPFSIGPRLCIGQAVAEMELKFMFGVLFHKFSFLLPPNQPKPTLKRYTGIISNTETYSLLVKIRN
ncbi:Cytochrome P450 2 sub R member 1 [Chamberlinius hualienensis]|uniref:Cytochrome P450 3201D1 n=1 Tax=Chamberlinius hualienensis TaxID=1551368 RepID=A0A1J1E7N0_9MYRI|nr:cytochrome P450 3201D1 [Chamberlinius hualienensis]